MKKIFVPLSICLTQIALADSSAVDALQPMTNYPARPSVNKSQNAWLSGEFLYWQAVESNLNYIYSGTTTNSTPEFQDIHSLHFNWNPGCRVGVGGNFERDGWDLAVYYTYMHNTASASKLAGDSDDQLFQVWTVATGFLPTPLTKASSNWWADLDQVELQLGREMFVGRHLTLRPYMGARSTWLFQQFNVSLFNDQSQNQKAKMHSTFWGFGFVVGVDSDWLFGKGFSLYGSADYSLLLGFYDIDQRCKQNGSPIWKIGSNFRAGRSIFDTSAGLKWMHLFSKDRYCVTLKAGYEYHLYFDQNQFINTGLVQQSSPPLLERYITQNGNLAYQGITAGIQFDF